MKVFITGGTGFVGSGIIPELLQAGHAVTGLARTAEAADRLAAIGATARRGDLADPAGLQAAAGEADAVIHCGYIHDFSAMEASARTDLKAIEAMIDGLAGAAGHGTSAKVFVCTSGTAMLPAGRLVTERDAADPSTPGGLRALSERAALAAAERGVRSAVIRLPPSVHGPGDHGFVPMVIDIARKSGVSAYLGNGENCWPAVHRDDAAVLYRVTMERLAAGDVPAASALHAVADSGVPFRELAGAIAEQLKLGPAAPREAEHFGWFAMFAGLHNPTSATITEALTGWRPTRLGLLDNVRGPAYATPRST